MRRPAMVYVIDGRLRRAPLADVCHHGRPCVVELGRGGESATWVALTGARDQTGDGLCA